MLDEADRTDLCRTPQPLVGHRVDEQHHRRGGVGGPQVRGQLHAVEVRQIQVRQHHVRMQQLVGLHHLGGVTDLADHLDVGLDHAQHPDQTRSDNSTLVHHEHPPARPRAIGRPRPRVGQLRPHPGAPLRRRLDLQRTAQVQCPGDQALQTQPTTRCRARPGERRDVETTAVVLDQHGDALAAVDQTDPDLVGPGVLQHVGQRLLHDPEELPSGLRREQFRLADHHQPGGQRRGRFHPGQLERDGVTDRAPVQQRRSESQHRPLHLGERGPGGPAGSGQRHLRITDGGDLALGVIELEQHDGQPASDGVVHVADHPFALGHGRRLAGPIRGRARAAPRW